MTDAGVVYVIDDDRSVRAALEDLLASVGIRVLTFGSTTEFLAYGLEDAPGCLVLDVRMPGQSGIDFHRRMAGLGIALPVVFITGHGDIPMGVEAIKQGAIEFLTKPFNDQTLLDAIQNGIGKDRDHREQLAESAELRARWAALSAGEQDVARLVVRGLLNKQIAAVLHVSEITVKVRRAQVMRKMNVRTLPDLVRLTEKLSPDSLT
ncbi:MAG: response regulator transcription factor [Acetobacter aceti]|uniref:DNA-binding response regulator n=1 Tax=Acetobacter aceti TaxID=435 RepID=A0A1U9KDH3_ACEAC|nr:response regulator transcription factor [Acetobacter aceti]AQS83832.1 DNA-binding response regulator [Acetobacter aceti]